MCREVNQIIEINLVTVCGGEKKKFVQCPFSGHQDVCVAHFTCVYVRFLCVPSNTKQASETTANQTAITSAWWLLCCVQVTLASTAPVWGLIDAPVQSSTDKPGWKGTWLRGDGAGGRAVSTKPKPPYLPDPVSHKSHRPVLSVSPASSVSRLVEEYIPWLRVFGDVRCQTVEFLDRLGVYFLWGPKKRKRYITGYKGKRI